MSRGDGFPTADVDTHVLDDPKFRALWRALNDQAQMCEAFTAYQSVLLASWATGERVTIEESAPLWMQLDTGLVDALMRVGLLDDEHRIPGRAWVSWYLPAYERREARRESGRLGGRASGRGRRPTDPQPPVEQRSSDVEPDRPDGTGPSLPSSPSDRTASSLDHGHASGAPEEVDDGWSEIRAKHAREVVP